MAEEKPIQETKKEDIQEVKEINEQAKSKSLQNDAKKDISKVVEKVKEKLSKDKKESKPELEREYVIPLRKQVMKAPRYRKAKKAIRTIKEFLAKHMKVENRDMRLVKIDRYLNQEIWYRGIRHPPAKIKVKAIKKDGIVYVELAEIPEKVKWDMARDKKMQQPAEKTKIIPKEAKEESKEEKKDEKEKEKATVEAGMKEQKLEAKQEKHSEKPKQPKQQQIHRMAMKR